jgi:hypothetical protein
VENKDTGEGHEVVPEPTDGTALNPRDWPYSRGDVQLLAYTGSELDDRRNCTTGGPNCATEADLDGSNHRPEYRWRRRGYPRRMLDAGLAGGRLRRSAGFEYPSASVPFSMWCATHLLHDALHTPATLWPTLRP